MSSILAKAKKLNVPMEALETGIEDIAGIRIMCQFVEDIERLAQLISEREDLKLLYIKDYITNTKESGYRSYHMIVEYPVQTALGTKKSTGGAPASHVGDEFLGNDRAFAELQI